MLYSSPVMIIWKEILDGCSIYHTYEIVNSHKFAFYKHKGRCNVRYIDVHWRVLFSS